MIKPLSDERRLRASAMAASVYERLEVLSGGLALEADEFTPDARQALDTWKRAFSGGEELVFHRRLAWDGLDEHTVLASLSWYPLPSEPAPWTWWVDQFVEHSGLLEREAEAGESPVEAKLFQSAEQPPFLELWIPILRAARSELARRRPSLPREISQSALGRLESQLVKEAALISELAVFEQFGAFHEAHELGEAASSEDGAYRNFVAHMLRGAIEDFFSSYPVLARHVARLAETWTESIAEFLSRLEADRAAIAGAFLQGATPGMVSWAETGLSDRHNGGRRVITIGFESGLRLVYKPRDVGMEAAFHRFLAWSANRGLGCSPRALHVIDRDGYGWIEYAQQASFEDEGQVREYYTKSGSLLCFAHVLRARDLHMENVIASDQGPVVVDAEMVLQPEPLSSDPAEPADARDEESCLSTGFLSLIETDPNGAMYDIGGLRGRGGAVAPLKKRVWKSLFSDALHFVEEDTRAPAAKNQVHLHGKEQRPERYEREIVDGFDRTYRFVLERRREIIADSGPLAPLAGQRARVLLRPTKQYAMLLYTLAAPKYQREGLLRSFMIEALNRIYSVEAVKPRLWPLVADERSALEGLDIPRFTIAASEVSLVASSGERVDAYSHSGAWAVRQGLKRLGEVDLERQISLIRRVLSGSVDSRLEVDAPGVELESAGSATELLGCALWVGEEFLVRSRPADGALTWEFRQRRLPAGIVPYDLYEGAAGVALFMAALGAITGDARWSDAAQAALRPIQSIIEAPDSDALLAEEAIGVCEGIGSLVYSACLVAKLLGDDSFLELALRGARLVTEARIREDRHLDIVGGAAGALLALLVLHDQTGEEWVLARAAACGQRLVTDRVATTNGGAAWLGEDRRLLAGFGHGAAGIAYALSRLFVATGDRNCLEVAAAAYRYERSVFSEAYHNWPVITRGNTGGAQIMTAWCHGAAGIGLGRTLALDVLSDAEIHSEIEQAMTTTAGVERGRSDHLCCGNLGRSEILLTVGQRLQRPECISASGEINRRVVGRALDRGHFALPSSPYEYRVFDPGFFRGLAGIGYQLLRSIAPQRVPSVLGFEAELNSSS